MEQYEKLVDDIRLEPLDSLDLIGRLLWKKDVKLNSLIISIIDKRTIEELDSFCTDDDDFNYLHVSIYTQNPVVFCALIKKGVNVNLNSRDTKRNYGVYTPIMLVIKSVAGDLRFKMVQYLLLNGAIVDGSSDRLTGTNLKYAFSTCPINPTTLPHRGDAHFLNFKIIKLLLQNGADPNYYTDKFENVLFLIGKWTSISRWRMIEILIKYNVDLNRKNKDGHDFMYYMRRPNEELTKYLVLNGWDMFSDSEYGCDYIHAVSGGHVFDRVNTEIGMDNILMPPEKFLLGIKLKIHQGICI